MVYFSKGLNRIMLPLVFMHKQTRMMTREVAESYRVLYAILKGVNGAPIYAREWFSGLLDDTHEWERRMDVLLHTTQSGDESLRVTSAYMYALIPFLFAK